MITQQEVAQVTPTLVQQDESVEDDMPPEISSAIDESNTVPKRKAFIINMRIVGYTDDAVLAVYKAMKCSGDPNYQPNLELYDKVLDEMPAKISNGYEQGNISLAQAAFLIDMGVVGHSIEARIALYEQMHNSGNPTYFPSSEGL